MDRHQPSAPSPPCTSPNLEAIQHEVDTRKEAIAKLRADLRKLEAECKALETQLPSPWQRTIPREILGEIFTFAIIHPVYNEIIVNDWRLKRLSLVCKVWQQAALATPALWTNVQIKGTSLSASADKVQTWLSRSGGLPKILTLFDIDHWSDDDSDIDDSDSERSSDEDDDDGCLLKAGGGVARLLVEGPILDDIRLRCSSIQCFQALVSSLGAKTATMPEGSSPWVNLHSLTLVVESWWGRSSGAETGILNTLPPSVTSLSLKLPNFEECTGPKVLPINLQHLTTLVLETNYWPVRWLLESAEQCPNIQVLTLDLPQMGTNWGEEPFGSKVYLLPNLRTLRIYHMPSRDSDTCFFLFLKAPELDELDICFENGEDSSDAMHEDPHATSCVSNFLHFLEQSQRLNKLRHLRIHSLPISRHGLQRLLQPFHGLQHLILDDVPVPRDLFDIPHLPQQMFLPKLRVLELLNLSDEFEWELFTLNIQRRSATRCRSGASLDKLVVTMVHRPKFAKHPNDASWVKELRRQGMEVTFTPVLPTVE